MRVFALPDTRDCIVFSGKMKDFNQFLNLKIELKQMMKNYDKKEPLCFFLDKCYPLEPYFVAHILKLKENDDWDIKIHTNDFDTFNFFKHLGLESLFEIVLRT